jgi:hypothetical protein
MGFFSLSQGLRISLFKTLLFMRQPQLLWRYINPTRKQYRCRMERWSHISVVDAARYNGVTRTSAAEGGSHWLGQQQMFK